MDEFTKLVRSSLDNDLSALVGDAKISVDRAIALQMLRLLRGRAIPITSNVSSGGWSADGVTWVPSEPGTFTGPGTGLTESK